MTDLYPKIKWAASTTRNPEIRIKLFCLLRGLKLHNVTLACEQHGIARRTYYRWLDRLIEGKFDPTALQDRSSRPHHCPRQIEGNLKDKILEFRKDFQYGPWMIAWYLQQLGYVISHNGVYKVLKRAGVIFRRRRDQKPNRHRKRYSLDRPGQGFQMDIKFVPLEIHRPRIYVFSAIDDCTRWRYSYAYRELGYDSAVDFVHRLIEHSPFPIESIQTDNDVSFTKRFMKQSFDYSVDHPFEALLATLNILHKLIPPGIKELNGKVERSFRTDMQNFYWKLPPNLTFAAFQHELARWMAAYNFHRPHMSLNMKTPIQKLAEFDVQPRLAQLRLAQSIQAPRISMADHFTEKLRTAGRSNPYFLAKSSNPKKKRVTALDALLELSRPLPPLCHSCGDSTKNRPYRKSTAQPR